MRKGLAKFPATLQCQTPLTLAVGIDSYGQEVLALECCWRFGKIPGGAICQVNGSERDFNNNRVFAPFVHIVI